MSVRALLSIVALSAACDQASSEESCPAPITEPGESSPQYASSPAGVRIGATTTHWGGEQTSYHVRATFRTEALPVLHAIAAEDGPCRRLEAAIYHCEDPCCAIDELCTDDNTCATVGLAQLAGALSVTVGDETTVLEPDPIVQYNSDELSVAECPSVTVAAAGDAFSGFALEGALVPPLEITNLAELGYFRGEGLTIRWLPADPGARVRITFRADSAPHGAAYPSIVECDVRDDAGAIDVPASMMDPHIAQFGCGFCPSTSVTRYRRTTTMAGATEVELVTEDEQSLFLRPGGIEL